jgi:short subunit dehydrogenase-like uncharacterized protein
MKGGFSGGTAASLIATLKAAARDQTITRMLANPFALTPGFNGPPQPPGDKPVYDDVAQAWAGPFIMASINTKNVHRTNYLLGHIFGEDFIYDEMILTGAGEKGRGRAKTLTRLTAIQDVLFGFAPTRALLKQFALPKPGQGPSKKQRDEGFYDVLVAGETGDGRRLAASVKGDKDPGYGSTSKMIAESAMCLAREIDRTETSGGIWTPGAAMGAKLIDRLQQKAGLRFALEN